MDDLQDVISRLERQREAIDQALAALRGLGGGESSARAAVKSRGRRPSRKRRGPSAEGRKRIAEAQRARWAAKRAAEAGGAAKGTGRKAAGRKRAAAA